MTEVVIPLTIRALTAADLPACGWSGSRTHLMSVSVQLERAARGEVEYLAVCPPSGLPVALGVEESNPRARALYERLGYDAYGREPDSWDEVGPDGKIFRYETMCTVMRKELSLTRSLTNT